MISSSNQSKLSTAPPAYRQKSFSIILCLSVSTPKVFSFRTLCLSSITSSSFSSSTKSSFAFFFVAVFIIPLLLSTEFAAASTSSTHSKSFILPLARCFCISSSPISVRQLRSKPRTSENDDWSCKPTFFARSNASANEEVEEEDMSRIQRSQIGRA